MTYYSYMINKLKKLVRQLRGLFPSALPVGVNEFNAWADNLAATYKLPTENMDSIKFSLASMVMHGGPTTAYKANFYFYLALNAAAAKQVAGGCFMEIKEAQKRQQAEALAQQNAAAVSDGQQI